MTNHNKLIDILPPNGQLLLPIMQIDNLSIYSKNILIIQAIRLESKEFRKFLDAVYAAKHKIQASNFIGMFYRLKLINDICNNAIITEQGKKTPTLERYFNIKDHEIEAIEEAKQIISKSLKKEDSSEDTINELEDKLSEKPSPQWRYNPKSNLSLFEQDEWIFNFVEPLPPTNNFLDIKNKAIQYIHKHEISPLFIVVIIYIAINSTPSIFRRFLDRVCRAYSAEYQGLFFDLMSINNLINGQIYSYVEKSSFVDLLEKSIATILHDFDAEDINECFWLEMLNIIVQTPKPNWRSILAKDFEKETPPPAKSGEYSNADEFKSINLEYDLKVARENNNYNEAIFTAFDSFYSHEGIDSNNSNILISSLQEVMVNCDPHIALAAVIEVTSSIYMKNNFSKSKQGALVRASNTIQAAVSEYVANNAKTCEIAFQLDQ